MHEGSHGSRSRVGAIVAIVGGACLFLGSFLTWASVSVNTDALVSRLAEALGISPELLQGQVPSAGFNQSITGPGEPTDGIVTLLSGLVAVAAAGVIIVKPQIRSVMGGVMVAAGVIGAGVALYDVTRVADVAGEVDGLAAGAAAAGLGELGIDGSVLDDIIDVSVGVGLWICLIGGVLALLGGIMALTDRGAPVLATPGDTPMSTPMTSSGTGFEISTRPSPSTEAPVAPTPPAPPEPPADTSRLPDQTPPPPSG